MPEENEPRRERIPKRELLHQTTPIPNVVLDEWLPHLSPAELKVVLYVARRSRGWGRDWDQISLGQLMTGIVRANGSRLDNGTGLGETACRRAVRSLISRGALRREEALSENGASEPPWYCLDLSWAPAHDSEDSVSKDVGVSESDRGRVSGSDRGEGVGIPTGEGVSLSDRERVSESGGHKRDSPLSPLGGGGRLFEVSSLDASTQKVGGSQKPPPQPSSSSSGKERRPTDDDYAEGAKRRAELVALGEDAPREEKGSEEEFGGWRDLEEKAKTIPPGECDWLAEDFAERFAPRLRLENKIEGLQQVHEWVARQNRDGFKPVWLVALRCAAEQEKGTVRHAWSHFLAAVANEWNDNIRHLPPPYTEEVLCGRVEVEETAHALEVLQNLPGWPPNLEKEVSALVLRCLWEEDYLFSTILESYTEYVRRLGGLQDARIGGEPAGALDHLEWFVARYPEYAGGMELTLDGRVEQREVASNTV